MNTKLKTAAKNDLEKYFFKLTNNLVFGKPMEKCEEAQRYQTINNR